MKAQSERRLSVKCINIPNMDSLQENMESASVKVFYHICLGKEKIHALTTIFMVSKRRLLFSPSDRSYEFTSR